MGKYYIDNLLRICILLLFPYHTSMIYNDFGENFYVKSDGVTLLSGFIRMSSPWFMPLLFFTKETDLTGYTGGFTPAHLWFILYLFIISTIALPIVVKYRKSNKRIAVDKLSVLKLLPIFLIIGLMSFILDIAGKSIGEYFALFMLGYILLSDDTIQVKLENNRLFLFVGFLVLTILNLLFQIA